MPCGRAVFHLLADRMTMEGWLPLGCDGSRMECPRTAELEQSLGKSSKDKSAPTLWVIALVSLTTGVLWSWHLGTSKTGERRYLIDLLETLPQAVLQSVLLCDAGYVGYDLFGLLLKQQCSFLIRLSSQAQLYSLEMVKVRSGSGTGPLLTIWGAEAGSGSGERKRGAEAGSGSGERKRGAEAGSGSGGSGSGTGERKRDRSVIDNMGKQKTRLGRERKRGAEAGSGSGERKRGAEAGSGSGERKRGAEAGSGSGERKRGAEAGSGSGERKRGAEAGQVRGSGSGSGTGPLLTIWASRKLA